MDPPAPAASFPPQPQVAHISPPPSREVASRLLGGPATEHYRKTCTVQSASPVQPSPHNPCRLRGSVADLSAVPPPRQSYQVPWRRTRNVAPRARGTTSGRSPPVAG